MYSEVVELSTTHFEKGTTNGLSLTVELKETSAWELSVSNDALSISSIDTIRTDCFLFFWRRMSTTDYVHHLLTLFRFLVPFDVQVLQIELQ